MLNRGQILTLVVNSIFFKPQLSFVRTIPSFTDISDLYISSFKLAGFDSLAQLVKLPKNNVPMNKGTIVTEVPYRDENSLVTLTPKLRVIEIM